MNQPTKSDSSNAVITELNNLEVEYEIMPCDPELADTENFCAHYGISPQDSANAILVVGKSEPKIFALCLLLATHRLDVNGVVRKKLGSKKASFAAFDATRPSSLPCPSNTHIKITFLSSDSHTKKSS